MIQSRIRRCFSRIRRLFERSLSEGRIQQLGWILGFIFVIVLVCVLLAVAFLGFKWQDVLSLFLDPGGFGQKEEIGHYDLFRLLATIIGLFLFSALLISVVSNMFENIADSFKNGHSRYSHKGHVLILGGGHQLAGMLSALARDPQSKTKDIVVLTHKALDGMEDGGGIIHHTKGIDHRLELLFLKAASDAVGETGAHEKHPFARADPKPRIRNIHYRPKLHYSLITINYSLLSASADLQSCCRQRHLYETGILILTMLS